MERSLKCTVFYDTGLTEYEFNFDYLRKKFVCVKYVASMEGDDIDEGQQLVYGNDYTVVDKRVVLRQANTDKKLICIYRQTPTANIVDFEDNSIIKAKDSSLHKVKRAKKSNINPITFTLS